jgi:hypothetical protein
MLHRVALVRTDVSEEEPHGVTSQKTPFFIVTAVKTSNLTELSEVLRLMKPIKNLCRLQLSRAAWCFIMRRFEDIHDILKMKVVDSYEISLTICYIGNRPWPADDYATETNVRSDQCSRLYSLTQCHSL